MRVSRAECSFALRRSAAMLEARRSTVGDEGKGGEEERRLLVRWEH